MLKLFHRLCNALAQAVGYIVLLLALVMLLSLSYQVLMRYVFNQAPPWTEELAVTCFSWSTLLGIGLGVRSAIHVRMDLLTDQLPQPLRGLLDRLVNLCIALVGLFLAWYGIGYVRDAGDNTSAAMGYSLTYLYASAPVCGLLLAVFGLERCLSGPAPEPSLAAQ